MPPIAILLIVLLFNHTAVAEPIIKSPNDLRQYKTIELANSLPVLLIHDPQAQRAAVSLNLAVGSASDPTSRLGLAHFLEHMLFLGTKKFPSTTDYSDFIESNGGSQNAFTARDNTNYFFDVKEQALEGAIERFAQFFIAPLFDPLYIQRERKAVHSEYQSKLKDDAQRNYHALKQFINPLHPEHNFFIGSLNSLSDTKQSTIREDLINFYQQQYSANRMTLVVLSKAPLSELEALVVANFSAITNKNLSKLTIEVPKYTPQQLPAIIKVASVKDLRLLTLSFPTPSALDQYKLKPLTYLSDLIGYEGKGSLMAYLKDQGYANALSAGSSNDSSLESFFNTRISLTKKGLENTDIVIASFFSFIEQLRTKGIKESLFIEQQQLLAQAFKFLPKQHPSSYVVGLSQIMPQYPQQHWLNAGYIMQDFDAQEITRFLAAINPTNMLVNLQAKNLSTSSTEPYFGTRYATHSPSIEQLALWSDPAANNALYPRALNPFIADDLGLVNPSKKTQQQIKPTMYPLATGVRLWHMQDAQFLTPKATLFFNITMPKSLSEKQQLTLSLYTQLVNDALNETLYDTRSAGLYTQLYAHRQGISVKLSGYSEKQPLLIRQLKDIAKIKFADNRFLIIKGNLQRSLTNRSENKPYQQLFSLLGEVLMGKSNLENRTRLLQEITLTDIEQLRDQLFVKGEVKLLSHGNILLPQALKQAEAVIDQLNISTLQQVPFQSRLLRLPNKSNHQLIKNIDSSDSALILYMQGRDDSYQQRVAVDLLSEVLANDYSNALRTEQQLGYLVFATSMTLEKTPGLALVVQSPSASPEQIHTSNKAFLSKAQQQLQALPIAAFEQYKASLISRYKNKERSIYQRSNRFWQAINSQVANFDHQQQLILAVKKLTLKDLQLSFEALLQRKIELRSYSNKQQKIVDMKTSDKSIMVLKALHKNQLTRSPSPIEKGERSS
ncbi:MAG: insulinase family protein [Oceanospirillaceae bacterium]|nr:insulinase family protein [Oceanospirillaceae bacterium]